MRSESQASFGSEYSGLRNRFLRSVPAVDDLSNNKLSHYLTKENSIELSSVHLFRHLLRDYKLG